MQSVQNLDKIRKRFLSLLGRINNVKSIRIHIFRKVWKGYSCRVQLSMKRMVISLDFQEWQRDSNNVIECIVKNLISENTVPSKKIQKTVLAIIYTILFAIFPFFSNSEKSWQFYVIAIVLVVSILFGTVFSRLSQKTSERTYEFLEKTPGMDSVLNDLIKSLKDFIGCVLKTAEDLYRVKTRKVPVTIVIDEKRLSLCKTQLSVYVRTYKKIIG